MRVLRALGVVVKLLGAVVELVRRIRRASA
jgi:hypothetical protein